VFVWYNWFIYGAAIHRKRVGVEAVVNFRSCKSLETYIGI
jgi:hypothetical protein